MIWGGKVGRDGGVLESVWGTEGMTHIANDPFDRYKAKAGLSFFHPGTLDLKDRWWVTPT